MKTIFLFLPLFVCTTLFALPCPNGSGIIYKGDSIETVIQQCGKPTTTKTTQSNVKTYKRLIYNRPHPYDQGHSQANILFTNDRVSNIHIFEYYTVYMCRTATVMSGRALTTQTSCGNWDFFTPNTGICGRIFGINDSIDYVKSVCGSPNEEINLKPEGNETTELIYNISGTQQSLTFQNGKFSDWK